MALHGWDRDRYTVVALASGSVIGRVEGHWCEEAQRASAIELVRHRLSGCVLGGTLICWYWSGETHCMGRLGSCWFILREGV